MLCQYCGSPLGDDSLSRNYAFGLGYDGGDEPYEITRIVSTGDCTACGTKNCTDIEVDSNLDYESGYDDNGIQEELVTG